MTYRNLASLAADSFRRDFRSRITSAANIILGIAVLFFFVALGQGIKAHISGELTSSMPEERLVVTTKKVSVSVLQFKTPSILGGSTLNEKTIERIKGFRSESGEPLVKSVHRELPAAFPVSISGNLFGFQYGSDVALVGIDASLVANEISADKFKYSPPGVLPVMVPKGILDMYNMGFALSNDLPELSEKALMGKNFRLHPGRSSLSSASPPGGRLPPAPINCYVAGLTRGDTLMGISVPIELVQELNRLFDPESSKDEYSRLYIDVSDGRFIPVVKERIKTLGFDVEAKSGSAERLMGYVSMGQMFFAMLAAVILISSCLTIFNSYQMSLMKRTGEFGLYSCLGASRRNILEMILLEALMLGLISGLVGVLTGVVVAGLSDWVAIRNIPDNPFKPDTFFDITGWLVMGCVLLAAVLSILSALPSAWRAHKLEPAIAITKSL